MVNHFKLFIVFYKTFWPAEQCLAPFVVAYMAPRPGDENQQMSARFSLFLSASGMGPVCASTDDCLVIVEF